MLQPISAIEKILLDECDSTNLHAIRQIHAGLARPWMVYHTPNQTAGKGQRGRQWTSEPGQNLMCSVILDPSALATSQFFRLSVTIALAASDFCRLASGLDCMIKWPNDLYLNDRKAGGILIENVVQAGRWTYAVAGIGINIHQEVFDPSLPNATSIKIESGKTPELHEALDQLLQQVYLRWQQLLQGGWKTMLQEYNERLYGRGSVRRLRKDNAVIPCLIREVTEDGRLVGGAHGEWQFHFGEVSWVL